MYINIKYDTDLPIVFSSLFLFTIKYTINVVINDNIIEIVKILFIYF